MRINPVINFNYNKSSLNKTKQAETPVQNNTYPAKATSIDFRPAFGTFLLNPQQNDNLSYYTKFYRHLATQKAAVKEIEREFPDGTDVVVMACSNNEEGISVYSLFEEKQKYKVHGYDIDDMPLWFANQGVYSVTYRDGLLNEQLKPIIAEDDRDELRKTFYNVMEETSQSSMKYPNEKIKNHIESALKDSDTVKYFKVKDTHKNNLKCEKGDILELEKILPDKQVGAIFFSNAFHHVAKNYEEYEDLEQINRQEILDEVINKVYDKLLPGGIFVLGDYAMEHIWYTDTFTPKENIHDGKYNRRAICKKSPLVIALERGGRFEKLKNGPFAEIYINSKIFDNKPLIWKKVG